MSSSARKAVARSATTTRRSRPAVLQQSPTEPRRLRFVLAALSLILLVALAYGNSLSNGFVWDDHEQIVLNPYLKPGAPIAPLFTSDVRFAHEAPTAQTLAWRPLQLLTYRAVVACCGSAPAAFHTISIAFAVAGALSALAVFWLLYRRLALAFAAAALFALHPVHTEAVDWIAALPDLGLGLFTLLAFALFLAGRDSVSLTASRRRLFHGLSLLAFLIALLWKETAIVFPLLIALHALLLEPLNSKSTGSPRLRHALTVTAPYFLVLSVYLALRFAVLRSFSGPRTWTLSFGQYFLSALRLFFAYWGKLLLPTHLNAYYTFRPVRSLLEPPALFALLLALFAAAALLWSVRRAPLAAFAALWVIVTLLPALDLNALGRNPFAERYLYLPSCGFCLLIVLAAAWLIQRLPISSQGTAGAALLLLVLSCCAALIFARNRDWQDDQTIFAAALPDSPDAPFVHYMVASAQAAEAAQASAAEQNFTEAIALASAETPPDRLVHVAALKGLASLEAERNQSARALQLLSDARSIAPGDPELAAEEGTILARTGQGAAAESRLNQLLAAQPNNESILAALGLIARDEHHDLARAAELFRRALAAHPEEDEFAAAQHNNLAATYADQENYAAAITELRHALAITPAEPEYHLNLATGLAATGHLSEAHAEAEIALQLAPGDPNTQELLRRLNQPR